MEPVNKKWDRTFRKFKITLYVWETNEELAREMITYILDSGNQMKEFEKIKNLISVEEVN